MTSSGLTGKQRRQVKSIAAQWRKNALTAEELYTKTQEIAGPDWQDQEKREAIKAELDRFASSPGSNPWFVVISVVLSAILILLITSTVWTTWKVMGLEGKMNCQAKRMEELIVVATAWSARINEMSTTATAQAMAFVGPSPTPAVPPTPTTPSPTPTDIPYPTPTLTLTMEPTPSLISPLVISGTVTITGTGQVNPGKTQFTLFSRGEDELDWTQGETVSSGNDDGAFRLIAQAGEKPRYYKIEVKSPLGAYVEGITAGDWKVITDTISGLIVGLESQQALSAATAISDIQITLAAAPEIFTEPITGTYISKDHRRTAPSPAAPDSSEGSVNNPVTVLGEAEGWHLACCQEIRAGDVASTEYFWVEKNWLNVEPQTLVAQLPRIYIPSGFAVPNPPAGWTLETADGLAVLTSQDASSPRLEWKIEDIQGWFHLEAWATRGSATANYEVFIQAGEEEKSVGLLAGSITVEAMPEGEMSNFKGMGTYHLAQPGSVVVRLQPDQPGVKAAYIRVIRTPEE